MCLCFLSYLTSHFVGRLETRESYHRILVYYSDEEINNFVSKLLYEMRRQGLMNMKTLIKAKLLHNRSKIELIQICSISIQNKRIGGSNPEDRNCDESILREIHYP